MKKFHFKFIFIVLLSTTYYSCSLFKPVSVSDVKSVTYDYTPKDSRAANSTDFLLALVNPQFASDLKSSEVRMYQNFRKSMGNDFEELAIAKGFRIKGPFDARDEMLYGDKEDVQMLLEIEIDP
jgi:hypothetical protein